MKACLSKSCTAEIMHFQVWNYKLFMVWYLLTFISMCVIVILISVMQMLFAAVTLLIVPLKLLWKGMSVFSLVVQYYINRLSASQGWYGHKTPLLWKRGPSHVYSVTFRKQWRPKMMMDNSCTAFQGTVVILGLDMIPMTFRLCQQTQQGLIPSTGLSVLHMLLWWEWNIVRNISRVCDRNGASQAWYIVKIHHSGWKPLICNCDKTIYFTCIEGEKERERQRQKDREGKRERVCVCVLEKERELRRKWGEKAEEREREVSREREDISCKNILRQNKLCSFAIFSFAERLMLCIIWVLIAHTQTKLNSF